MGIGGNYAGTYSAEDIDGLQKIGDAYGNDVGTRQYDSTAVTTQAITVYDLDAPDDAELLFHIWATKGCV